MNKQFFYESLEKKSPLFSAMLNFNLEQHKTAVPHSNLEKYIDTDFLSGHTIKKYQKAGSALFWDFADETKRLALLDSQSLTKLARILGVSLYAEEISHTLDKKSVLELQNKLGKELYLYALERGKFRLHELKKLFQNDDVSRALLDKILQDGEKMLALCTRTWQEELKQIFSQNVQETLPFLSACIQENPREELTPAVSPRLIRLIWFSVKKLLFQEVNNSWLPYFN